MPSFLRSITDKKKYDLYLHQEGYTLDGEEAKTQRRQQALKGVHSEGLDSTIFTTSATGIWHCVAAGHLGDWSKQKSWEVRWDMWYGARFLKTLKAPKRRDAQILVPVPNLATPLAKNCLLAKVVFPFPTLHCWGLLHHGWSTQLCCLAWNNEVSYSRVGGSKRSVPGRNRYKTKPGWVRTSPLEELNMSRSQVRKSTPQTNPQEKNMGFGRGKKSNLKLQKDKPE